ncbi:MAG: elongation factor G [Verrucomicrobia bacterium]|nr:elongation factor G [Verrucomicrobiota bacterium]
MKKFDAEAIRNVCLLSHGGVGKTSLMEALSFISKATPRLGRVDNDTSNFDYRHDEKERKMSVSMALGHCEWKDTKVNLIDTPGFLDLIGDTLAALSVVESAVVLVDAPTGVQVGTEIIFRHLNERNLPRLFFINGMDRENANFDAALESLQEFYHTSVAPVQIPIGSGAGFKGVVDLISKEAFEYTPEGDGKGKKVEIPQELAERVQSMRVTLMESVAETDEELMDKYFEAGELSTEELKQGIAKGTADGSVYPVFCGSALKNMGADLLLDAMVDLTPSAASRNKAQMLEGDETKEVDCAPDGKPVGFVFKVISEEHIGEFSLVRVFSGKIANGADIFNSVQNITERPVNMYYMCGRERIDTPEITTGDIGAMLKLKSTHTNHTLVDKGSTLRFPPVEYPEPLFSVAIHAKNKGDEDKLGMGLSKLHEEDPTFQFKYYPDIKQELLSGMGEVHLEIILDNLKRRFKVEVDKSPTKISYRETITKPVKYVEYTHKKQSGGAGQFGRVAIDVEPVERGEGYEFVDKIVGGVIDQPFRPSVDKGIRARMDEGILAGYPIVDIRVYLVDGKTHPVDSKDIAFQIAGREAFKLAFEKAGPILLEPVDNLRVTVPDKYTGDVMGDISSRRGKISGMEPEGKNQTINAKVPEAEVQNYAQALKSITQGRGFYTKSFSHYDPVPAENAKKIIEASKKHEEVAAE